MIPAFPWRSDRQRPPGWYQPGELAKVHAMIDGLTDARYRRRFRLESYEPTAQLAYAIGWTEGEKTRRP